MTARIRTIKPDFFLDEELYDLEASSGVPIRVAFAGLWTQADREGRFEWRPRSLKSVILPFDNVDFEKVLVALDREGFIRSYELRPEVRLHPDLQEAPEDKPEGEHLHIPATP